VKVRGPVLLCRSAAPRRGLSRAGRLRIRGVPVAQGYLLLPFTKLHKLLNEEDVDLRAATFNAFKKMRRGAEATVRRLHVPLSATRNNRLSAASDATDIGLTREKHFSSGRRQVPGLRHLDPSRAHAGPKITPGGGLALPRGRARRDRLVGSRRGGAGSNWPHQQRLADCRPRTSRTGRPRRSGRFAPGCKTSRQTWRSPKRCGRGSIGC